MIDRRITKRNKRREIKEGSNNGEITKITRKGSKDATFFYFPSRSKLPGKNMSSRGNQTVMIQ